MATAANKNVVQNKNPKQAKRPKRYKIDRTYLMIVCVLLCFGLIMLISASTPTSVSNMESPFSGILRHCLLAGIALLAMAVCANIDYHILQKNAKLFFIVSLIMMALVPFVGITRNGARRWLGYGSLTFQPSEIAKIALIVFFAKILSEMNVKDIKKPRVVLKLFFLMGIAAAGALFQSHLSGAVIIVLIGMSLLIVAGLNWGYIVTLGGIAGLAAIPLAVLESYRLQRLMAFRDPWADPKGAGWQIIQSLYAIGSGGLFGMRLGQSRQKYFWLPEASNDYIFSVLAEELGLIGCIVVIILFGFLVWRGITIAIKAKDRFGALVAFGITAMIGLQVVINIGVVTNVLPSTGMQLPFFSSGGTSLIIIMGAMGIMLNISRYSKDKLKMVK